MTNFIMEEYNAEFFKSVFGIIPMTEGLLMFVV